MNYRPIGGYNRITWPLCITDHVALYRVKTPYIGVDQLRGAQSITLRDGTIVLREPAHLSPMNAPLHGVAGAHTCQV